ncbi:hypothetical protein Pve01_83420 [Planomonospora venezuelensis]|nr:hypothetical protein Pve01_83420 [Planomonospora venezuelensis]
MRTPITIEVNLTERAQSDWDHWCRAHHPSAVPSARVRHSAYAQHGLPTGWVEMSRYQLSAVATITLFSQPNNNWGMLTSHYGNGLVYTVVSEVFVSLTALVDGYGHAKGKPLVRWLRDTITGLYDPTDSDEAAEQTLMGLGAPVTRIPRAAQRIPAGCRPIGA